MRQVGVKSVATLMLVGLLVLMLLPGAFALGPFDAAGRENVSHVDHVSLSSGAAGYSLVSTLSGAMAIGAAGDVNGDGYDDIITGSWDYSWGRWIKGTACLYYGSATGVRTTPAWTEKDVDEVGGFGMQVSGAGDVNGDGYDDVLVGSPGYANCRGRAYLFYGSSTGLGKTYGWIDEGSHSGDSDCHYGNWFGIQVSAAGDVNSDSYADIIVASPWSAYVYYGSPDGPSTDPDWSTDLHECFPPDAGLKTVSTAGDVNGDGYDDIIVGCGANMAGHSLEGEAYVFYGSASGLSKVADWTAKGNVEYSDFGSAVGTAGDVNSDGCDEVIVGAPGWGPGCGVNDGRAYLFYGSPSGLDTTPGWIGKGDGECERFGNWVGRAGDMNSDGYDDVIVAAPENQAVYLYYGSSSGLSVTADWKDQGGYEVGTAGDVNGDCCPEFYSVTVGDQAKVYKGSCTSPRCPETPKVTRWEITNLYEQDEFNTLMSSLLLGTEPRDLIRTNVKVTVTNSDLVDKMEIRLSGAPSGQDVVELSDLGSGSYGQNISVRYELSSTQVASVVWQLISLWAGLVNPKLPTVPPPWYEVPNVPVVNIDQVVITDIQGHKHAFTSGEDGKTLPVRLPTYADVYDESYGFPMRKPTAPTGTLGVVLSPADLLLTDSEGRRVGAVHEEGAFVQEVNEIPGSLYWGRDSELELVYVEGSSGVYSVDIVGTESGVYHLDLFTFGGDKASYASTSADIEPGEEHSYRVSASPSSTRLARMGAKGLSVWIWIVVGVGAVLAVGAGAYLIRRRLANRQQ